MKRQIYSIASGLILGLFSLLGTVEKATAADLQQIRQRGKLVAATHAHANSYLIYKGRPMGFDYELLQGLAKHLGLEVEIRVARDAQELFLWMQRGDIDLMAASLGQGDADELLAATDPTLYMPHVLVQRRPSGIPYQQLSPTVRHSLARSPYDLANLSVHVKAGSSPGLYLHQMARELDIPLRIVPQTSPHEELIAQVAAGLLPRVATYAHLAHLESSRFDNLDVDTQLGDAQPLTWRVRAGAPQWLRQVNAYLAAQRRSGHLNFLYRKYFLNVSAHRERHESGLLTTTSGRLSHYDDLLRGQAERLGWDWRLLAALVYQESRFRPDAVSPAGARGLMQIMPATARRYGLKQTFHPEHNIRAGVENLLMLSELWMRVPDPDERLKFVLAAYNVGVGHVLDARQLARKYGKNPDRWRDVARFLEAKSEPRYYTDPVVRHGYCRGSEPTRYVTQILARYAQYQQAVPAPDEVEFDRRVASWRDYLIIKSRLGENELLYRPLITRGQMLGTGNDQQG